MRTYVLLLIYASAVVLRAGTYTTYIGDQYQYQVAALAVDAAGNTYLTGSRIVEPQSSLHNSPVTDVFVSKLDTSGNLTLLGTFGGKGSDQGNGIAVDSSGNIYVAGTTSSPDFPLRNPVQSSAFAGVAGTGFLMKLASDGSMMYSTFLEGTLGPSSLAGVAADGQGNAYVTGWTLASDYQHTAGLPQGLIANAEDVEVYAAWFGKISATGSEILYAGALSSGLPCGAVCMGQSYMSQGDAIAVDPSGNAYIAGNSVAGVPGTAGTLLAIGAGAFVAKVNAAGNGMVYVTSLTPAVSQPGVSQALASTGVSAILADSQGDAYISGATSDTAFPVTAGSYQTTLSNAQAPPLGSPSDAFVAKLNPSGSAMIWATLLGGSHADEAQTLALDSAGDVWVSGLTSSPDFPGTVSVAPGGGEFLAEFNPTGSALLYSAVFPTDTVAQALAVDATNAVDTAGNSGLVSAFPASAPPGATSAPWMFGLANAAGGVLAGRVAPGELISIYGLNLRPAAAVSATASSSGFLPTTLGGVAVTINGTPAPLLYVSRGQINAIAPVELTAGSSAELQLTQGSTVLNFYVRVDAAAPGVFLNPNGGGAAAINPDGTINSPSNPAPDGGVVAIWATGTGYFPGSDGQIATAANTFCTSELVFCGVLESGGIPGAAGTPVMVTYSGAAPGDVNGVVQINFQVSATATFGYYLTIDGFNSNSFIVYTAPGTN